MNKTPYSLVMAGLLVLGLGCATTQPRKLVPGERSHPPVLSAQPLKTQTLAVVIKTDPNLMVTFSVRTDTLDVLHREPLTDEEKRALALWVEDGLALPFENSSVFERVEKHTALSDPSGPHGTDYVLIAMLGTTRPYRSPSDRWGLGPSGVALHAQLLDTTGREIWQLPQTRDRPRTLWPPRRRSDYEQSFDEWGRPRWTSGSSDVEGQIHRVPDLSRIADEIYHGVLQAILTSR